MKIVIKFLQILSIAAFLVLSGWGFGHLIETVPSDSSPTQVSAVNSINKQNATVTKSVTHMFKTEHSTKENTETEAQTESKTQAVPETKQEAPSTTQSTETPTTTAYKYETGYIFMGDSRFYLMNIDCGMDTPENFFVVACPGIGYDWMVSKALPKIESIEKLHPEIKDWVVVSGLGINDMNNINSYIKTYKTLAKSMDLKLLSVNPTLGRSEAQYSNNNIDSFNQRLQELTSRYSSLEYINCHDYLMNKGYWMTDGVHYNTDSNWDIYAYILDSIYPEDCTVKFTEKQQSDRAGYAKTIVKEMSQPIRNAS